MCPGSYYNLPYYLNQKDNQIAQLIQGGNTVQELNRGTIELSRMMNRVSQETDFAKRKQWGSQTVSTPTAQEADDAQDSKVFDFRVSGRVCFVFCTL